LAAEHGALIKERKKEIDLNKEGSWVKLKAFQVNVRLSVKHVICDKTNKKRLPTFLY